MKRIKLLFLVFSIIQSAYSYSQSWQPVGAEIRSDYGILTEAVYNGELYAGGWFYSFGDVMTNNMARWNHTSWDSVGSGLTGGQNYVASMCVYNGKLYACGSFFATEGMGTNNIAVWDGAHWDTVSRLGLQYCGGGTGWADAMAVYNGKLYVAGAFCHAGGMKALNIACWDGTKWDSVSSGINDSVNALAVYNGKLYAGGQFTRAGLTSVSNMACWNDTSWTAVGTGTNAPVLALQAYMGNLYVGGEFSSAGGNSAHYIAKWNGAAWAAVGNGVTGSLGVEAFCVFNGLLYTGGAFNKTGSLVINNVATWNGTAWDTVSTQGINGTVDAFAVLDSNLYAAGIFTRAGKVDAMDIAVWTSNITGVSESTRNNTEVIVYPNPNNGVFTIHMKNEEHGSMNITIYNVLGEVVYSKLSTDNSQLSINISNQPTGVYFYRVLNGVGSLVNQGKIVVQ